jgi:hypothetical protein
MTYKKCAMDNLDFFLWKYDGNIWKHEGYMMKYDGTTKNMMEI